MPDYAVMEGDLVMFMPNFGAAVVAIRPGKMMGTGLTVVTNKKICLRGDESQLQLPGCVYTTPLYTIPGTGTLKINILNNDQVSQKTKSGGKQIILQGSQFVAVFEVQVPAQQVLPSGNTMTDATPQYPGNGRFVSFNKKFKVA